MKKQLISFAGNHLGDNIRNANVFDFEANPVIGGVTYTAVASSAPGALNSSFGVMDFIPQVEPGLVAGANASLVVEQTPAAGGPLAIRGLSGGAPYAGYYMTFVQSLPVIQLDNPRSVFVRVLGTALTPTNAFDITVQAADIWGNFFTVTSSVAGGGVVTQNIDLLKSAMYVRSISVSAGTGAPIWVGVGKTFGMDYYTPATRFLTRVSYAETSLDIDTGGVFSAPPALDVAPTATSNDVRGAITIPLATAIDGVSSLNVQYVIYGATAQAANNYSVPAGAPAGTNPVWTTVPNSTRTLRLIGAPQYYLA